jgi:hypothetical protein
VLEPLGPTRLQPRGFADGAGGDGGEEAGHVTTLRTMAR